MVLTNAFWTPPRLILKDTGCTAVMGLMWDTRTLSRALSEGFVRLFEKNKYSLEHHQAAACFVSTWQGVSCTRQSGARCNNLKALI